MICSRSCGPVAACAAAWFLAASPACQFAAAARVRPNWAVEEEEKFVQDSALLAASVVPSGRLAVEVAPVVFVPGITSSALEARRKPGTTLGEPKCEGSIPRDGWYSLYVSAKRAANVGCLLWQLQLQSPRPSGDAPDAPVCVEDAEGIEVREVGFGGTGGSTVLNPHDMVPFKLYEEMVSMLESIGLKRGETIRFATYDWRKYGDPCWESRWFPRLKELVEETANATGKEVNLACHSMGCPLVHVFLNQVSAQWKQRYIREFVATGPAFGGATAVLQSFIQGPTYGFLPLAVSTMGRATINSMPGVYTLLPARIGNDTWPEDLAIVSTEWKNYTIASIYDGTFFDEVEAPEGEDRRGEEKQGEIESAESRSHIPWADVRAEMDQLMTEQGCVCAGECSMTLGGPNPGMLDDGELPSDWSGIARPWCYTHGTCGNRALRLQLTLNVFRIFHFKRWDYCGGDSKPIDAGAGFEFFPGVDTRRSGFLWRLFGVAESYGWDDSLQIEEQKARCLEQAECTGFDTDGYLKRGTNYRPDKSWRGVQLSRHGVIQGLYMKKPEVQHCQVECGGVLSWWTGSAEVEVCGTDGQTYESECHLNNTKCWKPWLKLESRSPCRRAYRTPQGCECVSECGAKENRERFQDKGCYVKGDCGFTSSTGKRWDRCMDSGGIDTGKGFEYFPRTVVPDGLFILREVGWFETYHMDKLQDQCGVDPLCAGFSTDGKLFTNEFRKNTSLWRVADDSRAGIYRKMSSLAACQHPCGDGPAELPVCHKASRKTFPSACAAENYRCFAGLRPEDFKTLPGPRQHYGDTGLHDFGRRWVERVSRLDPPGVPMVCMWVTDVETELAWRYGDFLSRGEAIQTSAGDGTVNAQSAEGPCRFWSRTQEAAVRLMPLKLGGASHVTMLWNRGFLDAFKRVVLKDDISCPRVDGAIARNSVDPPACKCAIAGARVHCGARQVAERKFNLSDVLNECSSPLCATD